jgi:hypothetical protein
MPDFRSRCESCGKVAFGSRREARNAARAWSRSGMHLRAYHDCPRGYWHVTSWSLDAVVAKRERRASA